MTTDSLAIGIDLGATKIAAALLSRSGKLLATRQVQTRPADGAGAVLERIARSVNGLAARAPGPIAGVGLGTPGHVSPAEGVVRNAVNLRWQEVNLAAELRPRFTVDWPVWIQKDTNASTLGEYYLGAARGCPDFVYLTVGSGLGAGVMANGALVLGANDNAAELGHFSLDPDGRPCACGLRGCAETVVSGPGLLAVARELLAAGEASRLADTPALTPEVVVEAAHRGDKLALEALAQVGRWLGIVMGACAAVVNPGKIVVGGGLGLAAADVLLPAAMTELQRRVVPGSYNRLEVVRSPLKSSAAGAACLVWWYADGAVVQGGAMQGT